MTNYILKAMGIYKSIIPLPMETELWLYKIYKVIFLYFLKLILTLFSHKNIDKSGIFRVQALILEPE